MNTNINNYEYLSVENLQLLIENIKGYFNEIYPNKFNYDKIDLNKLFYENMMKIIQTNKNIDLKTTDLNIETLKIVRDIIEKHYKHLIISKKPSVNFSNNSSIIDRENIVHNRKNTDNKLTPQFDSNTYNNNSRNIKDDYDKIIQSRNIDNKKNNKIINFEKEKDEQISSNDFNANLERLEKERNNNENIQEKKDENNKDTFELEAYNNDDTIGLFSSFENTDDNTVSNNLDNNVSNNLDNNVSNNLDNTVSNNLDDNLDNLIKSRQQDMQMPQQIQQQDMQMQIPQQEQQMQIPQQFEVKRQKIIISGIKRDISKYPDPYNYTIEFKKPIENIVRIVLTNVLIEIPKLKTNINYYMLKLNNFNNIGSNDSNIDSCFSILYNNKNYNDEIIFDPPLAELNNFKIEILNKTGNKLNYTKSDKKLNNIFEFIIEFI